MVIAVDTLEVCVTADDIRRAPEAIENGPDGEVAFDCPIAQALMRMGFAAVEVASDLVWIGLERWDPEDEMAAWIEDFDEGLSVFPRTFRLRRHA